MAYPQSSLPKGSTSTKGRNPLKNPLGENIPSIIENRGTRPTISIRKENLKSPFHKHPANASIVERKVYHFFFTMCNLMISLVRNPTFSAMHVISIFSFVSFFATLSLSHNRNQFFFP